ncbi:hypothetical protein BJF79_39685 [Actinomadura sp. CNU-125]|uniref:hypothetical protein n=1 Tax=Actinomadura sp. CNU-125 TaxID=1904961 RepID=UPI000958EC26|nr:hypothetical protein [Actinomadura sp. CNU-125]OLT30074.1 hypothetical protein BJF79_39685 [Actinomadura sp. CNU-125]
MAEQLTLGELIAALSAADQDLIVPAGFDSPHSYRGVYAELAFEPAGDVTVAAMLASARDADGAEYEGWKGGWFTMTADTRCHLAYEGCCGYEDEDALTRERLEAMLAAGRRPETTADRVESLIASTMDEVESIGQAAPEDDEPGFYDRLDEILDDASAGHKRNDIVDRIDALYRAPHVVTIEERDEALAQVERLRGQLAMHLAAWRHAARRARASRALRTAITADRDRLLEVGAATVATWRERAADAAAERDRARRVAVAAEQTLNEQIDRAIEAEETRDRYRLAWQSARRGRAEARAEVKALEETVAAADAERDRLERDVTFLTEIVVGTVLLGADDAIGMVRALAEHVAASGELSADQVERVTAGLDKQQADRDRIAEQAQRVRALCAGGPGPHNERQIWISDVLAALDAEPGA